SVLNDSSLSTSESLFVELSVLNECSFSTSVLNDSSTSTSVSTSVFTSVSAELWVELSVLYESSTLFECSVSISLLNDSSIEASTSVFVSVLKESSASNSFSVLVELLSTLAVLFSSATAEPSSTLGASSAQAAGAKARPRATTQTELKSFSCISHYLRTQ